MGAASVLFIDFFPPKHKDLGTLWQLSSESYQLVTPWKICCRQAYLTKHVFYKALLIGITLCSHLFCFYWLCPLSAFPMTMPGISAKITGLESSASFHLLSKVLANIFFEAPPGLLLNCFLFPSLAPIFSGFSQNLEDFVHWTPLLVLMFLLSTRYLGLQI